MSKAQELRENVARAIWNVMREYEDRCDMELEDMGKHCHAWALADAAISSKLDTADFPIAWKIVPKNPTPEMAEAGANARVPDGEEFSPNAAAEYSYIAMLAKSPSKPLGKIALPKPAAWTLQSELDAKKTTVNGHLWFSDPLNCMWTALYSEHQVLSIFQYSSASSEQQAAQQDAERWRAFSQGAVFPKLAFNNGNSHWQYGEIRGLSANAVADLVIAARASNGGRA